jgi:hypothetical protein
MLITLLVACAAPNSAQPTVLPTQQAAAPTSQVDLPIVAAPGPATAPAVPTAAAAAPTTPPTILSATPTTESGAGTAIPVATPAFNYDDRGDPIHLLASYYNAINRKEYQRAYAYWEKPQEPSLAQFAQGFADTASVMLAVRPPAQTEGAAGSVYASIPTLLFATHVDGSRQTFSGCYVARRSNIADNGKPENNPWSIYSATIAAAPDGADDAALLAQACSTNAAPQPASGYENRVDPVGLLASYYDAINRKEYQRAYDYWGTAPSSLDQFREGYTDTQSVLLGVEPPTYIDGAAGSQYASIPTLLLATHTDGTKQAFAGCYVTRRANPQIDGAPKDGAWRLERAVIAPAPAGADAATLLAQACTTL